MPCPTADLRAHAWTVHVRSMGIAPPPGHSAGTVLPLDVALLVHLPHHLSGTIAGVGLKFHHTL